jgi:hypothetical protein
MELLVDYWIKRIKDPSMTKADIDECHVFIKCLTHIIIHS